MDNMEATELVGVSARFGEKISDRNVEIEAIPLALPSLITSCNSSSVPVSISSFLHTSPWVFWGERSLSDWWIKNHQWGNMKFSRRQSWSLYMVLFTAIVFLVFDQIYWLCFFWQLTGQAALVRRGDCTFTSMARTAQAAGAKALVVINDKEGTGRKYFFFIIMDFSGVVLVLAYGVVWTTLLIWANISTYSNELICWLILIIFCSNS